MQKKPEFDVAVIGAGAAGLAAAQTLAAAKKRVAIIEARDRIGGRIHTIRDSAVAMPIELGAEFIHGRPDELIQIVRAANLVAYDAEGDHWHLEEGRLYKLDDVWEQIEEVMSQLPGRGRRDRSFAQFIQQCCNKASQKRIREMAIAFVEGFDAAPADRISAVALAEAQESSEESGGLRSMRIIDGFDRVIEHLHRSIDPDQLSLRLRSIVTQIEWEKGRISVASQGPDGEWRQAVGARCAIVTVPLGVLRAGPNERGFVRFVPEIPEKDVAAHRLEMGRVVKIIIQFTSPFWEDEKINNLPRGQTLRQMAFLHSARMPFATWWSFFPVRSRVLVGWAGGPSADPLVGQPQGVIFAKAIDALARMLGLKAGDIESRVERYWACDWQADPFARGAYSFVPVGAVDAVSELAKPVAGTLFFAGEATDDEGFGGTVDSAVSTGRRAAAQALNALGAMNR